MRRSRGVAAVPTHNVRQILAAVSQHLVEGSVACVVLRVDVGTVFEEQLDESQRPPQPCRFTMADTHTGT